MEDFICTWSTNGGDTVALPIQSNTILNITVDWGDGGAPEAYSITVTEMADNRPAHTYVTGGIKTIRVTGKLPGWSFNDVPNKKIVSITSYGSLELFNGPGIFASSLLESLPENGSLMLPAISIEMFSGCSRLGITGKSGVETLNTQNVTKMVQMFADCPRFNGNVTGWNVSKVQNMVSMFSACVTFTGGDLSAWNVSKVQLMSNMFFGCVDFNGDIGTWDVSNVQGMSGIFEGCFSFKRDISKWILSNIQGNTALPTLPQSFVGSYVSIVNPKFSTGHTNAWKFNATVTKNALNIIFGYQTIADKAKYYIDDDLRLRLATDVKVKISIRECYNASIVNANNTRYLI